MIPGICWLSALKIVCILLEFDFLFVFPQRNPMRFVCRQCPNYRDPNTPGTGVLGTGMLMMTGMNTSPNMTAVVIL